MGACIHGGFRDDFSIRCGQVLAEDSESDQDGFRQGRLFERWFILLLEGQEHSLRQSFGDHSEWDLGWGLSRWTD